MFLSEIEFFSLFFGVIMCGLVVMEDISALISNTIDSMKEKKIIKILSEYEFDDLKKILGLPEEYRRGYEEANKKKRIQQLQSTFNTLKKIYEVEIRRKDECYMYTGEDKAANGIYKKIIDAYSENKGDGVRNLIEQLIVDSEQTPTGRNNFVPKAQTPVGQVLPYGSRTEKNYDDYTH